MFNNTKFPYMNTQQLNLDWLLKKFKEVLKFMPVDTGNVGDVLQRKETGAEWEPLAAATLDINGLQTAEAVADDDEIPIYDKSVTGNRKATVAAIRAGVSSPVTSVNGKTGAVVLDADDVGALPDNYTPPVSSVNGKTCVVTLDADDVGALPDSYTAPVTSVNGKTGAVELDADDVGALPNTIDYVVEENTSGFWRYRKWESGFLEAWFYGSVDFTTQDGQYNGMYRHVQLIDNLNLFVATYSIIAGGSNSNMFISDASIVSNQIRLVLSHINSIETTITITATTIVETGRWK